MRLALGLGQEALTGDSVDIPKLRHCCASDLGSRPRQPQSRDHGIDAGFWLPVGFAGKARTKEQARRVADASKPTAKNNLLHRCREEGLVRPGKVSCPWVAVVRDAGSEAVEIPTRSLAPAWPADAVAAEPRIRVICSINRGKRR
jgi:hypothetical protein